MQLSTKTLLALLPFFLQQVNAGASGTGTTTRYWDCCKPSCSWPGKASLLAGSNPVTTCDIKDSPLTDYNAVNGCDGGGKAYMCSNEAPWEVTSDLAYGFAAVNIAGGSESSWCCACYELEFTSGNVKGKKMIVQATNTGGDLSGNQFDISMPGGGVGIFNGCTAEWGAPSTGWGAQYGGISSRAACDAFPEKLKAGCQWRYDWFAGSDNPTVSFKQVTCPAAITAKSGCTRADDSSMPKPDPVTGGAVSSSATIVKSSSSPAPAPVVPASSSTPAAVIASKAAAVVAPEAATSAQAIPVASSSAPVLAEKPAPVATSAPEFSSATAIPSVPGVSSATAKKPVTTLVKSSSKAHNHMALHTHKATTTVVVYDDTC